MELDVDMLAAALETLPPRTQRLLLSACRAGAMGQVAADYGVSEAAAAVSLQRAAEELRRALPANLIGSADENGVLGAMRRVQPELESRLSARTSARLATRAARFKAEAFRVGFYALLTAAAWLYWKNELHH